MSTYTLKARLAGQTKSLTFPADDDGDATMAAIGRIMDRAMGWSKTWAKGEIVLTAPDGRVVHRMDAKEES